MDKKCFTFNSYEEEPSDIPTLIPYTKFNSFDVHSPQYSGSPYHDTDSLSDKSKKIRKKRNTYQKIDDETRIKLLDAVQQGDTLKAAAKRYGINYSSAKSILHTFRKEGRILKKSAQERTVRKRSKASPDMEMSPIYLNQYQRELNGATDNYNYKLCSSPEFKPKASFYGFNEVEAPRQGVSGMPINSFGGFLRIGGPQGPQKIENLNQKSPTKTIVLNLESQRLSKTLSPDGKPLQTGNWQLNVNVHCDNVQKSPKPRNLIQEAQYGMSQPIMIPEKPRNIESYHLSYPNSSLNIPHMIKREEHGRDPRFHTFTNMMNNAEEINTAAQEQPYDVSCYLDSSPAYAFQQQRGAEAAQQGNMETFTSAMDNMRGVVEPQDMRYSGLAKSAYLGNYGLKLEEANSALIKAASLRSY